MGLVRWVFTPDSHGHYIDWDAAEAVMEAIRLYKPHHIIHGGDWLDLGALREKATPAERGESIIEDIEDGKKWINMLKPTVITLGNHDDRIYQYLGKMANQAEENNEKGRTRRSSSSLEEIGARHVVDSINAMFRKHKTRVIPFGKGKGFNLGGVTQGGKTIGGMNFTHGTAHGDGACKTMCHLFLGSVMFGDVHTDDSYRAPNILGSISQSVGSLCRDEDMDYQRRNNRYIKHTRNFAIGITDTVTGESAYCIAKKMGKKWVYSLPELH